ncbi:DUF4403 family protein [Sulfurovum sp.]|uniref:DUF4403 family protein n=1 Tax=Sulfurovum sp. TaxID=1969726 RepID=UPI002867D509|nr:DUF4403 family protein [Sulfurovum sp.]
MSKNISMLTVTPLLSLFLFLTLFFPSFVIASHPPQSTSTITLPIQLDLEVLENYLNEVLPKDLADINEQNIVCVKPQYFKTTGVPKCRRDGFKIKCKKNSLKIRTVPKIKCDVKGWVKRNGKISITGQGKILKFAVPVKAQVSANAKISETAKATAVIHIDVKPHINKDWEISVDMAPDIKWSKSPTIKLLEVVKITLQSKVEPKLKKKMEAFVKKVPQHLADLKIKEKVHTVWKDLQEPIKLDDKTDIYLLFKPKEVSYSGLNITNNMLQTTISAEGKTHIVLGNPTSVDCEKSKLCTLGTIPNQKGKFNFHLPVSISYQELLSISKENYLKDYSIDFIESALPGVLKISDPKIEKSTSGTLSISAHINYDNRSAWLKAIDIFNWFDVDGDITFKGTPRIDKKSRCLVLEKLVYDSTTNSDLFDLLVDAAELEPLSSYFATLMKFEFGKKIDDAVIQANQALSSYSKDDLTVSASLHMASIDNLVVNDEKITISTKLSGIVNANIGL